MRIRLTVPHDLVSPTTLGAALEASTRVAQVELANGRAPLIADGIKAGVRWRPEPPGDESFDLPSTVMGRRWGDCDDLAPWHAAGLRVTGQDPGARAIAVRSGPNRWHAIVQRSDGRREDPSRWAGMAHVVGQGAPTLAPMKAGRPMVLIGDAGVRIDVPGRHALRGCPLGYAVTVRQPNASLALRQAITGATRVGMCSGLAEPRALALLRALYRFACQSEDLKRALAIEGLRSGRDVATLAGIARYVEPEVGILPCLAAIGGIVAGVASAVGGVTAVVKAVVDAIQATAKAVEQGLAPIEKLYKQVKSAVDQGTISLEHVRKTADELRAQGHTDEADKLMRDANEAAQQRGAREFMSTNDPDISNPVRIAEYKMKAWRYRLTEATDIASAGLAPFYLPGSNQQAPAREVANIVRAKIRDEVLASSELPPPGPRAVWESLALAFGLDPATAQPIGQVGAGPRQAARIRRSPAGPVPGPVPQPTPDDGEYLTPGLDALFRRAGAFM